MLIVRGPLAHSHFRLERWLRQIHYAVPQVSRLSAEFIHFVDLYSEITKQENRILSQLLQYGQRPEEPIDIIGNNSILMIVIPSAGTVSSWSNRATEIAHHCALHQIKRIERGIIYSIESHEDLTWGDEQAIAKLLQDPATQTVVFGIEEALMTFKTELQVRASKSLNNKNFVTAERYESSIFHREWIIEGVLKPNSLFSMMKNTYHLNNRGILSAYKESAAIIDSGKAGYLSIDPLTQSYEYTQENLPIALTVVNNDHPTHIYSFSGAAVGVCEEIRDEVSVGRGARPKAGLCGFSVSNLNIPGFSQPWEIEYGKPTSFNSALEILLEASMGIAQFNNEFGRPNICGYFRTFEQSVPAIEGEEVRGYHKPIIITGGLGNIRYSQVQKPESSHATTLVLLGGDCNDPEMQRRCQEVINNCSALGNMNPIMSINDSHPYRLSLAVDSTQLTTFKTITKRESCPWIEVKTLDGSTSEIPDAEESKKVQSNYHTRNYSPVKFGRRVLTEMVFRLLRLPCIADKSFLITIHDRTATGLVARDPMVGPWQVPVADCGVMARTLDSYEGEAIALGERAPIAIINPGASARMSVGEAITNMAAASIGALSDIKLSANWIVDSGYQDGDARFYDAVEAIGLELCPQLGLTIATVKNSILKPTLWKDNNEEKAVSAPLSLVMSAFAPVMDIRKTLTPLLSKEKNTLLIMIDLSGGYQRLGGSAIAQVYNQTGDSVPDIEDPNILKEFFACIQRLNLEDKILAYHDRSDGGLFITICEMAFASHTGLQIDITELGNDEKSILFNEELGAVIQVREKDAESILKELAHAGIHDCWMFGTLDEKDDISIIFNEEIIFSSDRITLQKIWSETSFHVQSLRDNPRCAKKQFESVNYGSDPGLNVHLTFDISADITAPFVNTGIHPKVAIVREQGTNGHFEMAAAFHKARFECIDVHMNDLQSGHVLLSDFKGIAVCGGFSFGDVLGAGLGWAKRILFNSALKDQFEIFFNRLDTFTLGVSNGCQMLSHLKSIIPGAELWPTFIQNFSEQFESRLCLVEVQKSPSLFLTEMEGSQLLIPVANAEGRVAFDNDNMQEESLKLGLVALRYVDNYGRKTKVYPANPSGSPLGITGLTTPDGRVTILMPHPERAFRTVQYSWHPDNWGMDAPWLRFFRNARVWVG